MLKSNKLYNYDCRVGMKQMIKQGLKVDCVISSPPYWGLRDYDGLDDDQLGHEKTIQEFINNLCDIYDLVKEVLKSTGTNWVNLGDTYNSAGTKSINHKESVNNTQNKKVMKIKPQKCLLMIPQRFAIEMIDRGWILRNVIIWHKPNAMPSSAKDRFTVDFEYVYFFTKKKKYWFEQQKVPISQKRETLERYKYKVGNQKNRKETKTGSEALKKSYKGHPPSNYYKMAPKPGAAFSKYFIAERNMRTVWKINTYANPAFHFATFPPDLVKPMIRAGCPEQVCIKCGEPAYKIYEYFKELEPNRKVLGIGPKTIQGGDGLHHLNYRRQVGTQTCECNDDFEPGIVMDPFAGTGTTLKQAWKLDRRFIGFELSEEYYHMAKDNLKATKNKRVRVSDFF